MAGRFIDVNEPCIRSHPIGCICRVIYGKLCESQRFFCLLAFGDIENDGDEDGSAVGYQLKMNLNGVLRSIFPPMNRDELNLLLITRSQGFDQLRK